MKRDMIFDEIKDVKESIQQRIELLRHCRRRIQSIFDENIQSSRVNPHSLDQYIHCISKRLGIKYRVEIMPDFVNVMISMEKTYDINHPKSLQIKECYNNERIIYENVRTEYNQEICGELKQLNQRDTDELLSWLTILNLHISYLNFDLFIYRFRSELASVVTD
ncbi:hypothetical protein MS3_00000737 [Schistosoma haematobium]|uniref:Uncharacterized protein n=1 Tax=Schistosoma haematobium TaxID=6185 RepID=A0A922IJH0_SCHHA|nr:hypothetical protein MS3_00000737 [Schistosoma haematobium]KAH9580833.1 hypothetical protein MS3_00000737 [Schistosoma haematobium]